MNLFYDAFEYAKNPLNILLIDACRDDPWEKELAEFGTSWPPRIPDSGESS